MIIKRFILMIFLLLSYGQARAAIDDAPTFNNTTQQKQYYALINNIRCPTCQNNNVAESNAPLARQIRALIAEHIRAGESSKQISTYLVKRYGDFITYNPPFDIRTWLLWLAPAVIMLSALGILLSNRYKRRRHHPVLNAKQQAELRQWLQEYREHP